MPQDQVKPRIRHELKCWPQFFVETRGGRKKFELRRADRDFHVGDELLLKEWKPDPTVVDGYTGRELLVRVDYIMDADTVRQLIHPLLEPDEWDEYVIMSVSLVS